MDPVSDTFLAKKITTENGHTHYPTPPANSPDRALVGSSAHSSSDSPVWMRCGQHELEFHHAGVVLQLPVLYAIKLIGDISPSNIHLVKK